MSKIRPTERRQQEKDVVPRKPSRSGTAMIDTFLSGLNAHERNTHRLAFLHFITSCTGE